MLIYNHFTTTT